MVSLSQTVFSIIAAQLIVISGLAQKADSIRAPVADLPILKSYSRLVTVNVTARSQNRQPALDLTTSSIELIDQGRRLTKFNLLLNNHLDGPRPSFGTYSAPHGADSVINVLFIDAADTDRDDWAWSWSQVLRFVATLQPKDHIAIYLFDVTRGLSVLQDYNEDSAQLLKKVKQLDHPTFSTLLSTKR